MDLQWLMSRWHPRSSGNTPGLIFSAQFGHRRRRRSTLCLSRFDNRGGQGPGEMIKTGETKFFHDNYPPENVTHISQSNGEAGKSFKTQKVPAGRGYWYRSQEGMPPWWGWWNPPNLCKSKTTWRVCTCCVCQPGPSLANAAVTFGEWFLLWTTS